MKEGVKHPLLVFEIKYKIQLETVYSNSKPDRENS
jgi:hypothetical protein